MTDRIDEEDDPVDRDAQLYRCLRSFRDQSYGLRLSASHLAACVGLNPYSNLPELVLQLVYQGADGFLLQRNDARLLGIELVSNEEQLRSIATKGGEATRNAVETALLVQHQKKTLKTTDAVKQVHQRALQEARRSGKLSAQEIAVLGEGVRSAVFRGFGISHESAALDWYEANYCGCPVTERNSETKLWKFARDDTDPLVPSAVPVDREGKGLPRSVSEGEKDVEGSKLQVVASEGESDRASAAVSSQVAEPLFVIAGKIDGVREEMAPASHLSSGGGGGGVNDDDNTDDGWMMRRVLVECKHRIRALRSCIPVYEVVQATAYCYMFDAEVADLVQVLRKARATSHKRSKPSGDSHTEESKKSETCDIRNYFKRAGSKEDKCIEEKEDAPSAGAAAAVSSEPSQKPPLVTEHASTTESSCDDAKTSPISRPEQESDAAQDPKKEPDTSKIEKTADESDLCMNVIRLDLDDPVWQPRMLWHSLVLPRLRSFVEAVYAIRRDDSKRYQLLQAVAIANGDGALLEPAWSMLHHECPWLVDCDTAFYRSQLTY
jgi:hypothetical protein